MVTAIVVVIVSYLIGSISFGWLVAKGRGIDLFKVGSGNIGATNVGRVLGRKWAIVVFLLDFLKGAVPVAVAGRLPDDLRESVGVAGLLPTAAALATFLGHMFPIFLRFKGGKGAATGAGTAFVLAPIPTLVAGAAWFAVVGTMRIVSLGSVVGVVTACITRWLTTAEPFGVESAAATVFLFGGSTLLIVKHRANLKRIAAGTESRLEVKPMWLRIGQSIHLVAVGTWFGAVLFFNFMAAPLIFASFADVVENAPSDRTANLPLAPGADAAQRKSLASALAGSAVGPIFPVFFRLQLLCGFLALLTALGWYHRGARIHRMRMWLAAVAWATVIIARPISDKVTQLRIDRLTDEAAKAAFGEWHMISLGLSMVTALLAFVLLVFAVWMPNDGTAQSTATSSNGSA